MTFFYYSLLILFRKPKPVDWIQKHQSPTLQFHNILILQNPLVLADGIGMDVELIPEQGKGQPYRAGEIDIQPLLRVLRLKRQL